MTSELSALRPHVTAIWSREDPPTTELDLALSAGLAFLGMLPSGVRLQEIDGLSDAADASENGEDRSVIEPVEETPSEIRFDDASEEEASNSDDPAIYLHPDDPEESLVITSQKDGGLRVYDLAGNELDRVEPEGIRYTNVDILYDVETRGGTFDIAVASDRARDTLAIFAIDSETGQLQNLTGLRVPHSIFGVDNGEETAYGLATYTSPVDGRNYVFVTQGDGAKIAQLEIVPGFGNRLNAQVVRMLELPVPEGEDPQDFQAGGIVIDRETGIGYVVVEEKLGLLAFEAEPDAADDFKVLQPIDMEFFEPDLEGISIIYGENGAGALVVSSQGDSSFAVLDRVGGAYLGSFEIGASHGIDGVENTDGIDIFSGALGDAFPHGLLVVQDGSNQPEVFLPDPDDGELRNFNTNFKYVDLAAVLDPFGIEANLDYDPRDIEGATLPNGVASGDVTTEAATLWTRTTVVGDVLFEVASDPDFKNLVASGTVTATDADVPVKLRVEGLEPGADYHYRATDAAGTTLSGRFGTAAEPGQTVGLHFGVSGDWRGDLVPYPSIKNVPDMALDFFVFEGDTIYADLNSPAQPKTTELEGFREKYQEVYGQRFGENYFAELRASTPIYASIDDHEVINDFSGGAPTSTDPRFEGDGLINDTNPYEEGLQAWVEYHPVEAEFYPDGDAPGYEADPLTDGERKLYRNQQFGDDAAIFVLDNRSFRDPPLDDPIVTRGVSPREFIEESLTLERTMLGEAQLEDLKTDLLAAEEAGVTWKFVFNAEPIQNLGPVLPSDRYEGYANERNELLSFIEENDIDNVVFVAADVHATLVNNLTYSLDGVTQIPTSVFEVTTGAVAFNPPFAKAVVEEVDELGLLPPVLAGLYKQLPVAPDRNNFPNDKDDFFELLLNSLVLAPFGYDPMGLDNNLPEADGLIDATLIQGDYLAGHVYGWTEFEIDPVTQALTVTSWGIESYSQDELEADPEAILAREPEIVLQFVVQPELDMMV